MQLLELPVKYASADLDWKPIHIMPIGDVQLGAAGCDTDRLKRHIEWGMKQPDTYFIGMGDYVDVASPSNRRLLRAAHLYDSVYEALEEAATRAEEQYLGLVKGTEGRWLGLLEGHHYYEHADGTTSDTRIALGLGAPFLGDAAFLRLRFVRGEHSTIPATIWLHHGQGSGRGAGAPLAALERIVSHFDADIYLMGHMHKLVGAPIDQLYMSRTGRLKHRTKMIACTGSFLRGYAQDSTAAGRAQGGYVEKAMLPPVALGGIVLTLTPIHEAEDDRLDIRISL